MSSLYLNLYIQSDAAITQAAIRQFVAHVNADDYAAVEAMDVEDSLYDIDDILSSAIELHQDKGLFHLAFESASSLEVEVLVNFFHNLGADGIEISAFSSSTGETFYVNDEGEYLEDYADGSWKWLPSPASGFVDQYVVVTGTFSDYTRPELEELISQKGGKIQKSVNGKTTLLVIGAKPGADKTGKAETLGIRTMDEEELMDVLAGGDTLSLDDLATQPEQPDQRILAYQYCFPPNEGPTVWLPKEGREDLHTLLRTSGYLDDTYYQAQLETARAWDPSTAMKFKAYKRAQDIPDEERGPLNPRRAWDIAQIFSVRQTLISDHAHFIWEVDKYGYGHALAHIAINTGMPLVDIEYTPRVGAKDSFNLSCVFEGTPYRATFKPSQSAFPKPFVRMLYEMAVASENWDFIFHNRPGERNYVLLPNALSQAFLQLGFLKPLYNCSL